MRFPTLEPLEDRHVLAVGLDPTFGIGGLAAGDGGLSPLNAVELAGTGRSMTVQPDDKIVVVGKQFEGSDLIVMRFDTNGTLDTSFGGGDGIVQLDGRLVMANAVAVDSMDRIVVAALTDANAASVEDFGVARLLADGTPDTTFGVGGVVTTDIGSNNVDRARGVAVDANDNVIVVGSTATGTATATDFAVVRYLAANGDVDTSFGTTGIVVRHMSTTSNSLDYASAVEVDGQGRIVVAGQSQSAPGRSDLTVARFTPAGNLDMAFSTDGVDKQRITSLPAGHSVASGLEIGDGDSVTVVGFAQMSGSGSDFAVVRYDANGVLDSLFDTDGIRTIDLGSQTDEARGVTVDSAGNVIVAGQTDSDSPTGKDFAVVRLTPSGALDTSFDDEDGIFAIDFGANGEDEAFAVEIDSAGRVVVGGQATTGGTTVIDLGVARLAPLPPVVELPSGGGSYELVVEGGDVVVRATPGGAGAFHETVGPAGSFDSMQIVGADGVDDRLTVDFSGGNPLPSGGLTFEGGSGGNDALSVVGSGAEDAIYTPDATVTGNGEVVVSDGIGTSTITFTGLEPVDVSGMTTATLMTDLTSAHDTLTIQNGFDFATGTVPALRVSGTTGDSTKGAGDGTVIETVAFFNNTTVVIDTTQMDGEDEISIVTANNSHGNTNLTIDTGTGGDDVNITGSLVLAGTFAVTSGHVTLSGGTSSIRSLISEATVDFTGGSLTITDDSTINNAFNVGGAASLTLQSLTLGGSGTLTNEGMLHLQSSTLDADLDNRGTLLAPPGTSTINGALSTDASSTIRVDRNASGVATLTVADGFTNHGVIELTQTSGTGGAAGVILQVGSGTLINAMSGEIQSLPGSAGGSRTLNAQLENQGTLIVRQSLTVTNTGRTFTSSNGAIEIEAGDVLTINGGDTALGSGSVLSGVDPLAPMAVGSIDLAGAHSLKLAGDLTLTTTAPALIFGGTVTVEEETVGSGATLINQATLQLSGDTFNAALDNQGTLLVTPGTSTINGPFATSPTSTLRVNRNSSGVAMLTVANGFTNHGLIELTQTSGTGGAAGVVLNVTSGTLANAATGKIESLPGVGGTRSLNAQVNNQGTILVDQSLTITNAARTLTSSNGTIQVETGDVLTVNGGTTVFGSGTVLLGDGQIDLAGTHSLNLASDFTLAAAPPALSFGGTVTINGPGMLINQATLPLSADTVNADLDNQGMLLVTPGTSAINGALLTDVMSTIRVDRNAGGVATLTVSDGFTNHGAIELIETSGVGGAAGVVLNVTSGTLTNSATGQIESLPGVGGTRTLNAQVDNQGTLTVMHSLAVTKASAAHLNSGTVDVQAGTLDISAATSTYMQTAGTTIVDAGATLSSTQTVGIQSGTLGGNGTVDAPFVNVGHLGGMIAPGDGGAGILHIISDHLTLVGAYKAELGGTSSGIGVGFHDQIDLTGPTLELDHAPLVVDLINGFIPAIGDMFVIISNDGSDPADGPFIDPDTLTELHEGDVLVADGQAFQISYMGGDGNDVVLTAVPIDVDAPTVTTVTGNLATIADANQGAGTFTITIEYNEDMDQTVAPSITFPAEDPSGTIMLDAAASGWTDARTYVAVYDVADVGEEVFDVDAGVSGAVDLVGNPQAVHTELDLFRIDTENPTVTIDEAAGQGDPTSASPIHFTAVFSEAVMGFDGSDLMLGGTAGATTAVVSGGPATYDVAVSGMTADGSVTASLAIGAATDLAGNPSQGSTSSDGSVTFQASAPQVTSITPSDPLLADADAGAGNITVTVVYDRAMDTGADPTIAFSPSVAGTLTLASGAWSAGDTTYTATYDVADAGVEVNGVDITVSGAEDFLGNPQVPATLADALAIDTQNPTVTINQAAGQGDPMNAQPILFTVVFSEPVPGIDQDDVALSGTAGVVGATVDVVESGPLDATTYTVSVSGVTSDGTVTRLPFPPRAQATRQGTATRPARAWTTRSRWKRSPRRPPSRGRVSARRARTA